MELMQSSTGNVIIDHLCINVFRLRVYIFIYFSCGISLCIDSWKNEKKQSSQIILYFYIVLFNNCLANYSNWKWLTALLLSNFYAGSFGDSPILFYSDCLKTIVGGINNRGEIKACFFSDDSEFSFFLL